jgi:tRNA dimethylallyltransferase
LNSNLPIIYLMGPTASGKTEIAVELVKKLPLEIISVDSAMVYRGLDIGTAKPGPDILKQAPHHLIDICDPAMSYSAGRFREDATGLIRDIHGRGQIPLLTGGTGLYFRALERGFSALPAMNKEVRARLQRQAGEMGLAAMYTRLVRCDPESAHRIHPNDSQRILRALEVYETANKPMSEIFSAGRADPLRLKIFKIILCPADRSHLHERIKKRFQRMIELGLVDEVRRFYERGDLSPQLASMRLVGYRQIWRYLDGAVDYGQMLEQAVVATRQLAKRQMTWLRSETGAEWFVANHAGIIDKILKYLDQIPPTRA